MVSENPCSEVQFRGAVPEAAMVFRCQSKGPGWGSRCGASVKSTLVLLQRTGVPLSAHTEQLPSLTPVLRDLTCSCGLCRHQTCTWYIYIYVGNVYTQRKINSSVFKKSQVVPMLLTV